MARSSSRRDPVRRWLDALPDTYLECRARGYHVGVDFSVDTGNRLGIPVYLQTEVCTCGTRRVRGINKVSGNFVGPVTYTRPTGYSAPHDLQWNSTTREARGLFRLQRIDRFYARAKVS